MQNDQDGEESIEVDVKRKPPFNILIPVARLEHKLVANIPEGGCNDESHPDEVDKHDVEEELDKPPEVDSKHKREPGRRKEQPAGQEDEKGGVITGELSLCFLSVCEVSVDLLWFVEKVNHLPQCELEIHLPEVKDPPEVLVSLSCGRHAVSSVGYRGRQGRLYVTRSQRVRTANSGLRGRL